MMHASVRLLYDVCVTFVCQLSDILSDAKIYKTIVTVSLCIIIGIKAA